MREPCVSSAMQGNMWALMWSDQASIGGARPFGLVRDDHFNLLAERPVDRRQRNL